MCVVHDLQFPIHALDHAIHGGDGGFLLGEIGLE